MFQTLKTKINYEKKEEEAKRIRNSADELILSHSWKFLNWIDWRSKIASMTNFLSVIWSINKTRFHKNQITRRKLPNRIRRDISMLSKDRLFLLHIGELKTKIWLLYLNINDFIRIILQIPIHLRFSPFQNIFRNNNNKWNDLWDVV